MFFVGGGILYKIFVKIGLLNDILNVVDCIGFLFLLVLKNNGRI